MRAMRASLGSDSQPMRTASPFRRPRAALRDPKWPSRMIPNSSPMATAGITKGEKKRVRSKRELREASLSVAARSRAMGSWMPRDRTIQRMLLRRALWVRGSVRIWEKLPSPTKRVVPPTGSQWKRASTTANRIGPRANRPKTPRAGATKP